MAKRRVVVLVVGFLVAVAMGVAHAQKPPVPPPGESEPGVQGSLVRNGITICDPEVTEQLSSRR